MHQYLTMNIEGTEFQRNTLNNSLGNSPKVDGVIIYSLIKLTNVVSQPYESQTTRLYKYHQMKDLILTHIFPALIPKVNRDTWAKRYFKVTKHLNEIEKIEANLDYFNFLLQEAMILAYTILYSNNYYMLEDFSDADYEEMIAQGGVTLG